MTANLQNLSRDELLALVAKMSAQQSKVNPITCKVTASKIGPDGEKKGTDGAVALYGLGRFPVTLYAGQWERLIDFIKAGHLEGFLTTNAALLARKE